MIQDKAKNSLINWEIVSVNPKDKKWSWIDLFCFWGNNIQSIIANTHIGEKLGLKPYSILILIT